MDTSVVREGIASGNGFVGLHRDSGDLAQHLAGREKLLADYTSVVRIAIGTDPHRHHNLFERSVAGAFSDSVDRALHLPRSGSDCGQRISNSQAEIIVAVSGDRYILNSGPALANHCDQFGELGGHGVSD